MHKLTQFLFFEQWERLRRACHARSIAIMGDLPIFVAHDSADVWAQPELFRLDAEGRPTVRRRSAARLLQRDRTIVGQPALPMGRRSRRPDTAGGRSLPCAARTRRPRAHRSLPRLRGVVGSAGDATTALVGNWVKGPGAVFFEAVQSALQTDRLPFVAENLGVITPEVEGCANGWAFQEWRSSSSRSEATRKRQVSDRTTTPETWWFTPGRTTTTRRWDGGPVRSATAHDHRLRSRRSARTLAAICVWTDGRSTGNSSVPRWPRSRIPRSCRRRTFSGLAARRA